MIIRSIRIYTLWIVIASRLRLLIELNRAADWLCILDIGIVHLVLRSESLRRYWIYHTDLDFDVFWIGRAGLL